MRDLWKQWLTNVGWAQPLLLQTLDLGLVLALTYIVLVIVGERRTLWMVRGVFLLITDCLSVLVIGLGELNRNRFRAAKSNLLRPD